MGRSCRNILLTGPPRCGKSTLIERIVHQIKRPMTGFFTGEIREKGHRVGFLITTLDGEEGILAHRDFRGKFRVGKYGVNLEDIERIAVPSMRPTDPNQIVVVDEIGKMECFSRLFKKTLIKVLDSEHDVLGSISMKGDPFIQGIKQRMDVTQVHVSESNRDALVNLARIFHRP
jgi:nucleoside-triphosphatase THEP1